jgi:serine/threonine-protein kinase
VPDEVIAGRYRLLEPLGHGATSSVWLALDSELDRRVAVKTLAPTADRARFDREARAAASLSHPNICRLYDYGQADGRPYMVLEYLSGGSLEERLRGGRPLPDADTQRIAAEVADGLAHAHARRLVHRDLKPANILFDGEGRAKIADFGIARMSDSGTLTEAGTVLGTASYISPEQAAGRPAGPASDVYSFGSVLFRMLTGRLPFVAANAMEVVRMHRDDPPPPVASVRPDAPPRLAALADAALAKDPSARPTDGAALARALAGGGVEAETMLLAPAGRESGEQSSTRILPARQPRRRQARGALVSILAALVLAGGVGGAWLATRQGSGSSGTSPATSLRLPEIPAGPTSTEAASTVERTTTAPTTTAPTITASKTTAPEPTAATTTLQTTTAPETTAPATTAVASTALQTTVPDTAATTTPATTAAETAQPTTTAPETTTAP